MSCKHSNKPARQAADGFWQLVAAGEPFRLLFPLGAAIGVFGVLMWPLYVWKINPVYPGPYHARVMIEGFLTAFVFGFLGTALPRMLDVPRFTLAETLGFAGALIGITCLHGTGQTHWGDLLFLFTVLALLGVLGTRALLFRKDVPPPGFVLVPVGLGCALFGSATQIIAQVSGSALPEWMPRLGRLLLHQGYLVFPIMGVGAFLFPRFFDLPNRQSFPESLRPPPGWRERARFALFSGALVMAGFVLETADAPRIGNGLRAIGFLIYFLREVPLYRSGLGGGSLALGLRLAVFSIPLAYALMAVWPDRTFSLLHLLFISGFSLVLFIVASRVVLGHSGQADKFGARLRPVLILAVLVALAMLTRVSADWMPAIRLGHYAYAALAWAAGVLVWSFTILPGVRHADED
jgi:uncharacterized protein involved in response to NO